LVKKLLHYVHMLYLLPINLSDGRKPLNGMLFQVKENRNAATRVSVLLSGITIGLAGHQSDDPDVHLRLEGFKNNTLPRIDGLIEE